jgi:hypothetical protein
MDVGFWFLEFFLFDFHLGKGVIALPYEPS